MVDQASSENNFEIIPLTSNNYQVTDQYGTKRNEYNCLKVDIRKYNSNQALYQKELRENDILLNHNDLFDFLPLPSIIKLFME